jgi:hypothetical protein
MICPDCNAETGGLSQPQDGCEGVVCDECNTWNSQESWDKAERVHNRKQEAKSKLEYCLGCSTEMIGVIDNDPNGAENCTCARCRAEESHDYDLEPDVEFDRSGHMIEKLIVRIDANGTALSDDGVEAWVANKLARGDDIHVSNSTSINCVRYLLHKMSVAARPKITWVFYGKEVHFDDDLKSRDAWHHDLMNLEEKFLMELV